MYHLISPSSYSFISEPPYRSSFTCLRHLHTCPILPHFISSHLTRPLIPHFLSIDRRGMAVTWAAPWSLFLRAVSPACSPHISSYVTHTFSYSSSIKTPFLLSFPFNLTSIIFGQCELHKCGYQSFRFLFTLLFYNHLTCLWYQSPSFILLFLFSSLSLSSLFISLFSYSTFYFIFYFSSFSNFFSFLPFSISIQGWDKDMAAQGKFEDVYEKLKKLTVKSA